VDTDTTVVPKGAAWCRWGARDLCMLSLLAEVRGHQSALPWDWFLFPDVNTCLLGEDEIGSQGLVFRLETVAGGDKTWPLLSCLISCVISFSLLPLPALLQSLGLWNRNVLQKFTQLVKSGKVLDSEFPDTHFNGFSVETRTSGRSLGIVCPAFHPEVEETLFCFDFLFFLP
jgi:hypothetical protein